MPWKASSVMDERTRFVLEHERGLYTMTDLCEIYDIARETGYYWLRRYQQGGLEALQDRGRAPERHPNQTPEQIEEAVLELRRAHMRWGPRKLKRVLEREAPQTPWPAASTIGALLAREGLVIARKKRRRAPPYTEPFALADAPNRIWCADFKGWFRTGDGQRVDPLTITDAHTRYLLRCQQVSKTDGEHVQAVFEAAFREYGLPQAMRTDNGAPFASRAVAGLSRLAVWWMKLDCAGTHRGWASRAKREARTDASHVGSRDGLSPGGQPACAAASLPPFSPRVQRRASARSVGDANAERGVPAFAANVSGAGARAGIRQRHAGAACEAARQFFLEGTRRVSQRDSDRRTHWVAAGG